MSVAHVVASFVLAQNAVLTAGGGAAEDHCVKVSTEKPGPLTIKVVRKGGNAKVVQCDTFEEILCGAEKIIRVDVWSGKQDGYWEGNIETSTDGKSGGFTRMSPTQKGSIFQNWMAVRPNGLCTNTCPIAVAGRNNPKCTICTCQSKAGKVCALVPKGMAAKTPVAVAAPATTTRAPTTTPTTTTTTAAALLPCTDGRIPNSNTPEAKCICNDGRACSKLSCILGGFGENVHHPQNKCPTYVRENGLPYDPKCKNGGTKHLRDHVDCNSDCDCISDRCQKLYNFLGMPFYSKCC